MEIENERNINSTSILTQESDKQTKLTGIVDNSWGRWFKIKKKIFKRYLKIGFPIIFFMTISVLGSITGSRILKRYSAKKIKS
jgi:hypothetical protein